MYINYAHQKDFKNSSFELYKSKLLIASKFSSKTKTKKENF